MHTCRYNDVFEMVITIVSFVNEELDHCGLKEVQSSVSISWIDE